VKQRGREELVSEGPMVVEIPFSMNPNLVGHAGALHKDSKVYNNIVVFAIRKYGTFHQLC